MKTRSLAFLLLGVSISGLAIEVHTNEPALARVKRIYIEQLGGGRNSDQLQDMILAAVQNTGLFTITENRDNADAVLKGSGDERIFTEVHTSGDSIGMHASASTGSGSSVK